MSDNPYEFWGHDSLDAAADHPNPEKRALVRAEIKRRKRIRARNRFFDLGVMPTELPDSQSAKNSEDLTKEK